MPTDDIDDFLTRYTKRRVVEEAERQGVPREFAESVGQAESAYKPDVITGRRRSSVGAVGPMQLMPGTAKDLNVDPYDIDANVEGGVRYLKQQLNTFGGDRAKAAAAYNWGPGNVQKRGLNRAPAETRAYVQKTVPQQQDDIDEFLNRYEGQQAAPKPTPPLKQQQSTARRLGLKPAEGTRFDLGGGPPSVKRDPISDIEYQMRQRDMKEPAIAEARTRLSKLSPAELRKEHARLSKIFATVPETRPARLEEEQKRTEYYAQPLYKQVGREILGGAAETGAGISRAVRRVSDPIGRALGYGAEIDAERAKETESERQLAEESATANRMRSRVVRGLSAGGTQVATLAPVAALTGPAGVTALTALESDIERDPGAALASTIAAPVSMAAGRFVSPRAARVAAGIASRPAQKAAQLGIEGATGAGVNVGQYAATSAALGRPITAEDIAEQSIAGAGLGVARAPRLRAARPAPTQGIEPTILEAAAQPRERPQLPARGLSAYTRKVADIERTMPPGPQRDTAIEQARQQYRAGRRAALPGDARKNLEQPLLASISRQRTEGPTGPLTEPLAEIRQPAPRPVVAAGAEPTREPPRPPIPEVNQRLIERTRTRAEELIGQGQFDDAINELKAHQKAIKDAQVAARKSPGMRTALERQHGQAGTRIGQVRKMQREAAKAPKVEEQQPVSETARQVTPEMLAAENAPTTEQPISPRTPGGAIIAQPSPLAERRLLSPARRLTIPPAPSRPAGRPQRAFPGEFYAGFPRERRAMIGAGRQVSEEIAAGRGEKGQFGRIAQQMFKSTSGQVPHGQDAFFHDPNVKGALGLSRDAEMGEVRAELKKELARSMGVKAEEVSLTQISPRTWEMWARQKRLPQDARVKMRLAINRYQEGVLNDIEEATAKAFTERSQPRQGAVREAAPIAAEPAAEAPPIVGAPARKIQHSKFGAVTESPDQAGVRKGQMRVLDEAGKPHIIRNPRVVGNREAAFVKAEAPAEPPDIAQGISRLARTPTSPVEIAKLREQFPRMNKADFDAAVTKLNEEGKIALHRHDYPASLNETERANLVQIGNDYFNAATLRQAEQPAAPKPKPKINYTIPEEAAPELARKTRRGGKGHIMGGGLGGLQKLFERGGKAAADQTGVRKGFIRVTDASGKIFITEKPRGFTQPKQPAPPKGQKPSQPTSGAPVGRDVRWYDYLSSPLSNLNYRGTYERIAGSTGKEISEAFRRAHLAIARNQESRGTEIANLERTLRGYKTQLRDEGKPGLANWLDEHVAALHDPDNAFKGLAGFLKGFQYHTKLRFNPRSIIVNELQSLQTLWPHLTTSEFLRIARDARRKSIRERVKELASRESGGKVEQAGEKERRFDPFGKVSTTNRIMGHLAGEMMADKAGLTADAKARMASDWAAKVEFDNSRWDVPPLFRGRIAGVLGQFKPYTIKNLERLFSDWKAAPQGTESGKLARRAKIITSQLALGGVRSVLLPGVKEIGGVLILGGLAKAFQKTGMKEKDADKFAEAVYFGAPGLLEQDLSSSVTLLDSPYGDTPSDKLINFLGGPTISLVAKAWQEGKVMASAKDTAQKSRSEKVKESALRLGKAASPYTKTAESIYSLATTGKPPKLRLGKEEVERTTPEAIGGLLMSTPLRQTRFYEQEEAFDWQKRMLGQPQKPGRLGSFGGKLDAELRRHKLDYSRVDAIPGDTEQTQRERAGKVEGWLKEYGGQLVDNPRYGAMSEVQQKAAIQLLRRRIGEESNNRRPNLSQFRPLAVISAARESAEKKPRRERGKLVAAPE